MCGRAVGRSRAVAGSHGIIAAVALSDGRYSKDSGICATDISSISERISILLPLVGEGGRAGGGDAKCGGLADGHGQMGGLGGDVGSREVRPRESPGA